MTQAVGVIGLSVIGHPIAARILGHQLGTPLLLGTEASSIADSGIATGHDNPAL
jgi:hypothetical protein